MSSECPTCQKKDAPTLERPPTSAQMRRGAPNEDPAERQADEIGKKIADDLSGTESVGHGPLPKSVQHIAEAHLGVSVEGTHLDAGGSGQKKAKEESALAVTEGRHVAFGEGELDTTSREGRELLGHELVHVGQQNQGNRWAIGSSTPRPMGISHGRVQRKENSREPLAAVQGQAMFHLLVSLQKLQSNLRTDDLSGVLPGGPRLVTAMRAVTAKSMGTGWLDFAVTNSRELASFSPEEITDIIWFLGAPTFARYYTAEAFNGLYDGSVDPDAGIVTLYRRVKLVPAPGLRFGPWAAGAPEWERDVSARLEQFKANYKRLIEEQWSGKGRIRPACPVITPQSFDTRVVILIVEEGQHTELTIHTEIPGGRANEAAHTGSLSTESLTIKEHRRGITDRTGKKSMGVLVTTQIPAAHEFGHGIGLKHSRCPGPDDDCYGVTEEQRRDIMGAGHRLQTIRDGKQIKHDDFMPFKSIAARWGQDVFVGMPSKCNHWLTT